MSTWSRTLPEHGETASEHQPQFQLSIWRDYAPPHPVALRTEEEGFQVVNPDSRLQAEVYSWSLRQDYLAGVSKEETRNRLRELLGKLDISRPPAKRSLAVLLDFVKEAERAIAHNEAHPVPSGGGYTLGGNPLLALVQHLKWIVRCFEDRPGVSVSIR